jgi:phospholipid/cholesterol/gamma-HCH transport system ATP-binding protein
MIQIVKLNKYFGDRHVLKDISAEFQPGLTNLIIGQSGSGKTVLMKCLVGLLEPESGEIMYSGRNFINAAIQEKKKIRQELGMVFQGGALFDSMTVAENVRFPLKMFGKMSASEMNDRIEFCLHRVNLDHAHSLYPSEISGGMRKRVAIARAIALNPKYLFFDEPNSGLDPKTAILIDQLIQEITGEFGTTTVINTHDMNSVMEIGDKIIFIHEGQNYWEGTRSMLSASDNKQLTEFIFASSLMQQVQKNLGG